MPENSQETSVASPKVRTRHVRVHAPRYGAMQIPAPSKEFSPPTLTVRLDWIVPKEQACMAGGGCGTTKLIWHSPMYPATSPENSGPEGRPPAATWFDGNERRGPAPLMIIGNGGAGSVASAFGRKLKSSKKVSLVGVAVGAACPVGMAGVVGPNPTA